MSATARGAATRARITEAAAHLMHVRGAAATTLDDVRIACGVSKSQLYNNFPDRSALVQEVVAHHAREVLAREGERLARVVSLRGLQRWRDAVVQASTLENAYLGCVLGALSIELANQDDGARQALEETFAALEQIFVDTLARLRDNGTLRPDADPRRLGVGLLAALEGGHVLARPARDTTRLALALDAALDHVRHWAA